MARKIDVARLKSTSTALIMASLKRMTSAASSVDHHLLRWISQMTVVEIHSVWERYAENRLVAALNHDARHFIDEEEIKGISHVSTGLAYYVVRGGGQFFTFRSAEDLMKKGNQLLGKSNNPFAQLPINEKKYLDCFAAIRNCIVHGSDFSKERYKRELRDVYNIRYAPAPDEFLTAIDHRQHSPARFKSRAVGLAVMIEKAIALS